MWIDRMLNAREITIIYLNIVSFHRCISKNELTFLGGPTLNQSRREEKKQKKSRCKALIFSIYYMFLRFFSVSIFGLPYFNAITVISFRLQQIFRSVKLKTCRFGCNFSTLCVCLMQLMKLFGKQIQTNRQVCWEPVAFCLSCMCCDVLRINCLLSEKIVTYSFIW